MDGLVERLRAYANAYRVENGPDSMLGTLLDEAADRIEGLEADLHAVETALSRGSLQQALGYWPMLAINVWNETSGARQRITTLEAENAELRARRQLAVEATERCGSCTRQWLVGELDDEQMARVAALRSREG